MNICCIHGGPTKAKTRIEPHGVMCSSCKDAFFSWKSRRKRKTRYGRNK
jgi:hypothetical protein